MRSTSITGRVPAVEHENVAVRVGEVRHVADPRVEGLAVEHHTALRELGARGLDVWHTERDRRSVRPAELLADVRRVEQVEERVLAELELGPGAVAGLLEPERVPVE